MARALPHEQAMESIALEVQLQHLDREELLDFWEESQFLDQYLDASTFSCAPSLHYEQAIVLELQRRATLGRL